MATFNREDYTSFRAVNLRGSGGIRFTSDVDGNQSTLMVKASTDSPRQYYLPDKSGTLPIMGTFSVQLPAIAATTWTQSTIATVAGIRAEDALAVCQNGGASAGYAEVGATSASTSRVFVRAIPGNGNITLVFNNQGAATGYVDWVFSYLAAR